MGYITSQLPHILLLIFVQNMLETETYKSSDKKQI